VVVGFLFAAFFLTFRRVSGYVSTVASVVHTTHGTEEEPWRKARMRQQLTIVLDRRHQPSFSVIGAFRGPYGILSMRERIHSKTKMLSAPFCFTRATKC